jgi:dTDP-glucose 4,6-dehydratase
MNKGLDAEKYIKYVKDRPGHDTRYAINSLKAKKELSWEPKIEFEEGINKTLDWYLKNNKWLNAIVTHKDFINWEEKHY